MQINPNRGRSVMLSNLRMGEREVMRFVLELQDAGYTDISMSAIEVCTPNGQYVQEWTVTARQKYIKRPVMIDYEEDDVREAIALKYAPIVCKTDDE